MNTFRMIYHSQGCTGSWTLPLFTAIIVLLAPASWLHAAQHPITAAGGTVTVITTPSVGEIAEAIETDQESPAANTPISAAIIDLTTDITDILLLETTSPSPLHGHPHAEHPDHQSAPPICLGSALIVGGIAGGGELTESFLLSWLIHARQFRFLVVNKAWIAAAMINSLVTLTRWSVVTGGGCYGIQQLHRLINTHRGDAKANQ